MVRVIEELRGKVARGEFEFSQHAVAQTLLRRIHVHEVREAFETAVLVEDYPDDKYGPSCLVLGFTQSERPLHIHCSSPSRLLVKIVTVYEPDPLRWIDFRVRRPH
jgi:hypothetical protein